MKVGHLDTTESVVVIAEIGNNHEGSMDLAIELIQLAKSNGADAVKFQAITPERLISPKDKGRIEQLSKFCLDEAGFERLKSEADRCGIVFICTPFCVEHVGFLAPLVGAFKVSSGDSNFESLLRAIAGTGKPIILSTGLSNARRISDSIASLKSVWQVGGVRGDLALLHCVSSYPTPVEEAHLSRIRWLKSTFGCEVGYSDHVIGVETAIMSVCAGARIVEKHFTCAHDYSDFRDHQLSADPKEMRELVQRIRDVERMMGAIDGELQNCESGNIQALSRSIVARKDLEAGHVILFEDLDWLRPARGLTPGQEMLLVGKRLKVAVTRGDIVDLSSIED